MKGTIKKTLNNIGLADKEAEIYIFLGKRGPLKGNEISKQLKKNKGQTYRILKKLQKKGLVEATLEYPTRFTAVPFEQVIDSFIKSKRAEVDLIEESKKDLLSDWKKISQTELESSLERFSVIEGEKKIFNKISQMIKETKNEFISISSVPGLLKAEQFGIFEDLIDHPLKSIIKVKFLTQITKDNLKDMKYILRKLESLIDLKGKNPDIESVVFPRMVIRDNEEILLFISDRKDLTSSIQLETVLCTNCKSIINSFYGVFNDLWNKASHIEKRIAELKSGKLPAVMELIKNPKKSKKKYFDTLDNAKEEIFIVTSSQGLVKISKNIDLIRKWSNKGVSTKIMAPITNENLGILQELITCCEVRHIPIGYRETTIIDNRSLFQFNYPVSPELQDDQVLNFENIFFTNNSEYIKQTSENLLDAWIKTRTPPRMTLNSIISQTNLPNYEVELTQLYTPLQKISTHKNMKNQKVTKKIVLDKIKNLKRYPISDHSKNKLPEITRSFGSVGIALIHPPLQFNLPEFIIVAAKFNNESSFGPTNHLVIFVKKKKNFDSVFEPAVVVDTNPNVIDYRRMAYKGSPVENYVRLVKDNEFQIFVQGNSFFAGWTVSIPLFSGNNIIPPSCILFEGYGKIKSGFFENVLLSSRLQKAYFNRLDSFVTYFHPSMKYTCPGTEGFLDRETVFTSSSLRLNQENNIK